MTDKKYNLFRYIAGAIFLIRVVTSVISALIGGPGLKFLLIITNTVMAVGLLTKKDKIFVVGIGVCILQHLLSVIEYIRYDVGLGLVLTTIASIVMYILIVISLLKTDKYQKVGTITIVLLFAIEIIPEIVSYGFIGIISGLIIAIFSSVPMALAVIAIQNNPQSQPIVMKEKTTTPTTGEKLTKLKELLDMGAITQEEFDTKKKQILGL